MRKITLLNEFLMLLGPIISRFFACSNERKNINKNNEGCSLQSYLYEYRPLMQQLTRLKEYPLSIRKSSKVHYPLHHLRPAINVFKLFCSIIVMLEQRTLKNINNCLNTNIYSYVETSGGQSSNLYLNAVRFFNTRANQTSVAA